MGLKKLFKRHSKASGTPSTQRMALENLEIEGRDRDWRQLMMYAHVLEIVRDVPGDIAEFGVASGTSLMAFTRMNDVYNTLLPHEVAKKKVHGFDSFEGLPELDEAIDLATDDARKIGDMIRGGFDSSSTYARLLAFTGKFPSVTLHKGWFNETIPTFLSANPHISFSLLHIDCDLYGSTKDCLSPTIKRLNVGGVILFDEIFHKDYPGETAAFWEVYNSVNDLVRLEFRRIHAMPWKWYAVRSQ